MNANDAKKSLFGRVLDKALNLAYVGVSLTLVYQAAVYVKSEHYDPATPADVAQAIKETPCVRQAALATLNGGDGALGFHAGPSALTRSDLKSMANRCVEDEADRVAATEQKRALAQTINEQRSALGAQ